MDANCLKDVMNLYFFFLEIDNRYQHAFIVHVVIQNVYSI